MSLYTVYNINTDSVIVRNIQWPTIDGLSEPPSLDPNLVLLLESVEDDPVYDPDTHEIVSSWEYDTQAKTAVLTKTIQGKTLEEAKTNKIATIRSKTENYINIKYPDSDFLHKLYSESIKLKPKREKYLYDWINWIDQAMQEMQSKIDIINSQTDINDISSVDIDEAALDSNDPGATIDGALSETDANDLSSFLDVNVEVTDPNTGIKGPFLTMQVLQHRRALTGDSENPIDDGTVGILPAMSKGGWIHDSIKKGSYARPCDILFYYGYPNSFNSAVNGWNNESVAQDMAKYGIVVLGSGVQDSGHGDYANTSIIIPRVKGLNPSCKIFGYVSVNQSLANFQTKVDQWDTLEVHGIFLDEAGYDYGTVATNSRDAFNAKIDYVRGKTYARLCFANAWNTDHILGIANDPSYPNSTWNVGGENSRLSINDWVLLESLAVNTTAYSGNNGYESQSNWAYRLVKALSLRNTYKVNFASVSIIDNGTGTQDQFDFAFISALMASLDGFGSSDTSYGAVTAQVKWWDRPDVSNVGTLWTYSPSIQNDLNDSDVYHRYCKNCKMTLDFSTGAQSSSINKY